MTGLRADAGEETAPITLAWAGLGSTGPALVFGDGDRDAKEMVMEMVMVIGGGDGVGDFAHNDVAKYESRFCIGCQNMWSNCQR